MASRLLLVVGFLILSAPQALAQARQVLTLEEALRLAGATSENVAIAEAAIATFSLVAPARRRASSRVSTCRAWARACLLYTSDAADEL